MSKEIADAINGSDNGAMEGLTRRKDKIKKILSNIEDQKKPK
jgi:hypothetical protein